MEFCLKNVYTHSLHDPLFQESILSSTEIKYQAFSNFIRELEISLRCGCVMGMLLLRSLDQVLHSFI